MKVSDAGWIVSINVVAAMLIGCGPAPGSRGTPAAIHDSHDAGARDGRCAVDAGAADARGSEAGPVDAGGTEVAPPPAAIGTSCENPVQLEVDRVRRAENTRSGGPPLEACRPSSARQRFFAFTVPPGQRAVFTAMPYPGPALRLVARMVQACTATSCIDDAEAEAAGFPVQVSYDNDSDEPRDKIVAVSSAEADVEGTFAAILRFVPVAAVPAGSGDACGEAIRLSTDKVWHEQAARTSSAPDTLCPAPEVPQRFYALSVPPGQRAIVTVSSSPLDTEFRWRPLVRVLDRCDASRCVSVDRSPTGESPVTPVAVDNPGTTVREVIVTVASPAPGPVVRLFEIGLGLQPLPVPAPNATCDAAELLDPGAGVLITTGDTTHATQVGRPCTDVPPSSWKVLYYAYLVPPGRTLRVTLIGAYDRARLRTSCDSACLAEGFTTENSSPVVLSYTNPDTVARRVILELGNSRRPLGDFAIDSAFVP